MDTLLRGLHYSRSAILREVVENEFAAEVPEEKREAFVLKLLPDVYKRQPHKTSKRVAPQKVSHVYFFMKPPHSSGLR